MITGAEFANKPVVASRVLKIINTIKTEENSALLLKPTNKLLNSSSLAFLKKGNFPPMRTSSKSFCGNVFTFIIS